MPPYAYICCGERPPDGIFPAPNDNSLTAIDLANPLAPAFAGNIAGLGAPNFLQGPTNVAIKGNYAYVCAYNDDMLTIINISNPLAPVHVASLNIVGIYDVKISGNYAFVVTNWMNQLISVDITNPAAPFIADTVVSVNMLTPVSLYIQGDYAYIASYGSEFLNIFNISNPLAIAFVGEVDYTIPPIGFPCYVIVDGNYAYISDWSGSGAPPYFGGSFMIADVTNPAAPFREGRIGGQGAPNHMNTPVGLYKIGNYVYVCAHGEWYFNIVDVTNPAAPVMAGQLNLSFILGPLSNLRPREVVIRGNYAYVTAEDFVGVLWTGYLLVLDISNPLAPTYISNISGNGGAPNFLQWAYGLLIPSTPPVVQTNPATGVT